ncbi:MAG: glycoside hydrolase family 16 protein [Planctomycetota bacterium]
MRLWAAVILALLTRPAVLEQQSRADGPVAKSHGQWQLVWSDEFDNDGFPDASKWGCEVGFLRNNELQYYTKLRQENLRVENGHLVLEARKERWKNGKYDPSRKHVPGWLRHVPVAEYTSASIKSEGFASWTYGRFEVRAKLPRGNGIWPAIWLLGDGHQTEGWPKCGEIDIMEFVGYEPNTIHVNAHCKKYNHADKTAKSGRIDVEAPSDVFHVYAIEWHIDRIDYFVDGEKFYTFVDDGTGSDAWPFDKPHFFILNLAIGGEWAGKEGIDDSIFPQRYLVDYVRIYQQPASE